MAKLIGPGPVFAFELLRLSRRWQTYAGRSLFVAGQLAALVLVWTGISGRGPLSIRAQADTGRQFYNAMAAVQLALALLAAPASTAGAFYFERARGTLAQLLTTDLTATELVLGTLAARLVPLVAAVLCGVPFLALAALFGGIDATGIVGLILVTLGSAVLGCTLALTLSVWGTTLTEVVLATYAIWLVVILLPPIWWVTRLRGAVPWPLPGWLEATNPILLVFSPKRLAGGASLEEPTWHFGICLALTAALSALAAWRLRPVAACEPDRALRRRLRLGRIGGWLPGPSLDGNPALWREWHARRPTRGVLILWLLYAALAVACTAGLAWMTQKIPNGPGPLLNALQTAAGMLLLSISAAAAMAEERVHGSLDVLLATPLSTRSVLWAKWWGTFRIVPVLAVPPTVAAAAVAWHHGHWSGMVLIFALVVAYGAALTSLGLALATWVPRLSRAVGLCVSIHVGVTVGWPVFALLLTRNTPGVTGPGLASFSPFVGVLLPTVAMHQAPLSGWNETVGWLCFWTLVDLAISAVLLKAVFMTFDRCLGRVNDRRPQKTAPPCRQLALPPVPEELSECCCPELPAPCKPGF
jgi:ABC-type transport system involved in multi-copper enzyme maturation permease subunit